MDGPFILKIAILGGTGKEGPGLALRWANAGYGIIIGSRQEEKAQRVAKEINEKLSIGSIQGMENREAAQNANICVLTVVYTAHETILQDLKDVLQGKILVDTTARVDFRNPEPPSEPSAARTAQEILGPGVKVVAAFQNVPAHALRQNINDPLEMDVLVFSDDEESADEVIKLAEGGSMRAFYAGGLDRAIVAEGLSALLIDMNKRFESTTGGIRITGIKK